MSRKIFYFFSFLLASLTLIILNHSAKASTISVDPQYLLVHKAFTATNTCCRWDQRNPESFNQASVDEILNTIQIQGGLERKLGMAVSFSYFGFDRNENREHLNSTVRQSLINILALSEQNSLPVFICLDGFQWWEGRPDLWNWWDPEKPGYNPNNKLNVEWYGWGPEYATKISWFNWGQEMSRAPAPNIASSSFRSANKEALEELVPIIVNWYRNLPENKKYLFAGIKGVWEVDFGVNHYFYNNGNDYLGQSGTPGGPNGNFRNGIQLGYAAAKTGGLKTSGNLTPEDLDSLLGDYVTFIDKIIYDNGIPRSKIYSHVDGISNGNIRSDLKVTTGKAALDSYAHPGWSFYEEASNPATRYNFNYYVDQIENTHWGAAEWLRSGTNQSEWESALRTTFSTRNNKIINILNWEGIRDYPGIINAIHNVLTESPSCWLNPPLISKINVDSKRATLSWEKDARSQAEYLNISNEETLSFAGRLKNVNVVNQVVTGQSQHTTKELSPGTYYAQIITDACGRRTISEVSSFTIGSLSLSLSPGWNQITWPNVSGFTAKTALEDIDNDCGTGTAMALTRKRKDWWGDFVKNYGGESFNLQTNQNYFINVTKACNWTP